MFNVFVGIFQRGGCTISKGRNTQTHRSAITRYRHGDRGARGSTGSCSANGPRGCGIFAKYICSVRVCAMGQIGGLTSRQNLEKKYLVPISDEIDEIGTKHPFPVDFAILEIVRTNTSPLAVCTDLTLGESCKDQDQGPTLGYHEQWPYYCLVFFSLDLYLHIDLVSWLACGVASFSCDS